MGDIKPGEVGIDFWARLAWNIDAYGPDAQPRFLHDFAARTFGPTHADAIAALYGEFYRLGQIRKPELMTTGWAAALPPEQAASLLKAYVDLLDDEKKLAGQMPPELVDAWTELAGYPAEMLAATGQIFLQDRLSRSGPDPQMHAGVAQGWRKFIESETAHYNEQVAGGKWRHIMSSGEMQGSSKNPGWKNWAEIHWPWLEAPLTSPAPAFVLPVQPAPAPVSKTVPASAFNRKVEGTDAHWVVLAGLGHSAGAAALEPAAPQNAWNRRPTAKARPASNTASTKRPPAMRKPSSPCCPPSACFPG